MILELKTFQDIAQYPTPSDIDCIVTHGYYGAGDGGEGFYKRVASVPGHGGYGVSATGGIFEFQPGDYVSPEKYGAVGDGVADDTVALRAMGDHARIRRRLEAKFLPGKTYIHKNPNFLAQIPYIKISAYGAKIKNTLGSAVAGWTDDRVALNMPIFWTGFGPDLVDYTVKDWGDLIQSADAGANIINIVSGNARVAAGARVLIYGFEGLGSPSNPPTGRVFEYALVESVSGGQITLAEVLRNSYDAQWPDSLNATVSNPQLGAPRIVSLDRPGEFIQTKYLEICGLETLINEAWTDGLGTINRNGRIQIGACDRAVLKDIKVAGGMYVLQGGVFELTNVRTHPEADIEIDKMIHKVILKDVDTGAITGATATNVVEIEDGHCYLGIAVGPIDRLSIKGGNVNGGGFGSSQAMMQITHGVRFVEVEATVFSAIAAARTSLFSVTEKTLPIVSVVSQTASDAVLDIGTQAEYEASFFMRAVGQGYTLYDASDLPVAIIKRLPYLDTGRMLMQVKPSRTLTTSDTLSAPCIQKCQVTGARGVGLYGHQLVNAITPLGHSAIEGISTTLEFP